MKDSFLDIPIDFERLKKKNREHSRSGLEKSIAQNIFLIITTQFGEHRFDYTYGCEIWDADFELISNVNMWKEKVRKSIDVTLNNHEKRLINITVDVDLTEEEAKDIRRNIIAIKKRVGLTVKATTRSTGIPFNFETKLYISPLSLD